MIEATARVPSGNGAEPEVVAARGLELRVHRDIAEVDPAAWDSLLRPVDIQRSHRFIRCCQESGVENAEYRHVLVYRNGDLVAVTTLSRIVVPLDVLATGAMKRLIGAARRVRPGFLEVPVLICGLPVSFGQPCVALRAEADAGPVVGALADLMERVAAETATPLLCWKEFDDRLNEILRPLQSLGYFCAPSLPSCSLAIRWRSFDEYAREMRAGYRRQLESTLAAGKSAGLRTRRVDAFAGEARAIFGLYEQVIDRARYRLERLNQPFFEALDRVLGRESRALLMERDGRLVTAAVSLYAGGEATFLLTGIDYSRQREAPAYENLVTEVIRDAIESGATRLEMGQTSTPLKSRMGAVESRRWIYLRHRSRPMHRALRALSPLLFPSAPFPARRVFRSQAGS